MKYLLWIIILFVAYNWYNRQKRIKKAASENKKTKIGDYVDYEEID